MEATYYAIPACVAYLNIPSEQLRGFVDGIFPELAKCSFADTASGFNHRYVAGHDLLVDVPRTLFKYGPAYALHHAGHILLTDFPTRAGIPFPGLSQSGLGHWLESFGIGKGWLSINISKGGFGVLAVADGHHDLAVALAGSLHMNPDVFFHTYIEGSAEIVLSCLWENPITLMGGIEKLLAGLIATFNSVCGYMAVSPIYFLGHSLISAIFGFTVSSYVASSSFPQSALNGCRAGVVGGLFAVSPAFGFAAIAGLTMYAFGNAIARKSLKLCDASYCVDKETVLRLYAEIISNNPLDKSWIECIFKSTDYFGMNHVPQNWRLVPDESACILSVEPIEIRSVYSGFDFSRPHIFDVGDPHIFHAHDISIKLPPERELL